MPKTITRELLQDRLAASAPVLLEALPVKYYDQGHLPGALHFPHEEARARAEQIVPNKAAEIIVYCASDTCQNSHIAAATLTALGYTDVSVYAAGKKDWVEADLPLQTG